MGAAGRGGGGNWTFLILFERIKKREREGFSKRQLPRWAYIKGTLIIRRLDLLYEGGGGTFDDLGEFRVGKTWLLRWFMLFRTNL